MSYDRHNVWVGGLGLGPILHEGLNAHQFLLRGRPVGTTVDDHHDASGTDILEEASGSLLLPPTTAMPTAPATLPLRKVLRLLFFVVTLLAPVFAEGVSCLTKRKPQETCLRKPQETCLMYSAKAVRPLVLLECSLS